MTILEPKCQVAKFNLVNATLILQFKGNYTIPSSPTFPSDLPFYKLSHSATKFSKHFKSLASVEHPVNVPWNITTRIFITFSMNDIDRTSHRQLMQWLRAPITLVGPTQLCLLQVFTSFPQLFIFNIHVHCFSLVKNKVCSVNVFPRLLYYFMSCHSRSKLWVLLKWLCRD